MRIVRSHSDVGASSRKRDTFAGEVWSDPVLPSTDGVTINALFFAPSARTNWHSHEHGQLLQITGGAGWVCTQGESLQPLFAGDVVWVPADEVHWHGADIDSFLTHTAISFGRTAWGDPVSDDDYKAGHHGRNGGNHV